MTIFNSENRSYFAAGEVEPKIETEPDKLGRGFIVSIFYDMAVGHWSMAIQLMFI